jgi:hypothetical protein
MSHLYVACCTDSKSVSTILYFHIMKSSTNLADKKKEIVWIDNQYLEFWLGKPSSWPVFGKWRIIQIATTTFLGGFKTLEFSNLMATKLEQK